MKLTPWPRALSAAAVLLASLGAAAQGTSPSTPASPSATTAPPRNGDTGAKAGAATSLERSERRFIEKAAADGMAEVALGKLAEQRASDPKVKAFAQRMVQDHTKANQELMDLARAKGVTPPATLDREHRRDSEKLGKLQGAQFDREFMKHMVDDHKDAVQDFEKASRSIQDPELKDFAARTLPTLQEHRQIAQTTYDAVKSGSADASAAPASR
jgi:putative membrane protein